MSNTNIRLHRPRVLIDVNAISSRAVDVMISLVAILLLGPLMLAIACALWLEGGRPILFSQLRLGKARQPFKMYKFRKFSTTCDNSGCPVTVAGDNRLTTLGRLLAATKLDELPQLWNVLKGEMAIVGPRPESFAFADCFRNGFEQVLDHKPGLLGPSQIQFRNEAALYPAETDPAHFYREVLFPTKARIDLAYFPYRTLRSDFLLIGRGVLAVCGLTPPLKDGLPQSDAN